jgi:U3 small nucleolar ribonucleoprotein component
METEKFANNNKSSGEYANKEMLTRINKLEDQMMSGKSWNMGGEI